MVAGTPNSPVVVPPFEVDESEIYAEDCVYDPIFAQSCVTAQPELEAWFDAHPTLAALDRRDQTKALQRDLIQRAVQAGFLTLRTPR
jgi:hypothetical protein